jgi:hypothetical protein
MCREVLVQARSNAWRSPAHFDHHRLRLSRLGGGAFHHPGEDALVAPSLPPIVEGLGWAIILWRITPPQAIAIDEDYATQNAPVIKARHIMALRTEKPKTLHLHLCQPEKIAHQHPRQFGSLNHAGMKASSRSMGPDPK